MTLLLNELIYLSTVFCLLIFVFILFKFPTEYAVTGVRVNYSACNKRFKMNTRTMPGTDPLPGRALPPNFQICLHVTYSSYSLNSCRNLPLSIVIGILTVVAVYVLVNISYFTAMSIEELIDSPAVAVVRGSRGFTFKLD